MQCGFVALFASHPNYFFESLIWLSFALVACGAQYGYLAFLSPLLILFLLFRVTGIPATEEQALRSKGEACRSIRSRRRRLYLGFRSYR